MPRPKKPPLSGLEKAIASRERGIARMEENIRRIRRVADEDIAAIEKRMAEKKVLLDALKRGAIKT